MLQDNLYSRTNQIPSKRKAVGLLKNLEKKSRDIVEDKTPLLASPTLKNVLDDSFEIDLNSAISDVWMGDVEEHFSDPDVFNSSTLLNAHISTSEKTENVILGETFNADDINFGTKVENGSSEESDNQNKLFGSSLGHVTSMMRRIEAPLPSANSNDISVQIKEKLLGNATKESIPAAMKSSGWTQFETHFSASFNADSQFHELGPFYGLPARVKTLIEKYRGISSFYSWQEECLKLRAIKARKNLVFALPTSGGKTLVAEILILREILCSKRNVLFVLPFVAIVQEKMRSLSPLAVELGFLVEEYAAGKGSIPPRKRRRKQTVIIATIEKALAVVQSLIETKRLDELGLIVVDELHLIGEGSGRGATLESLLTYLMFSSVKCHIVGMSATIGNLNEISRFLNADLYTGNFRPVELSEYVKCGDAIHAVDWKSENCLSFVRNLPSASTSSDPDGLCGLVQEVCPSDSVLIFCPTKKNCENVASLLCKHLPKTMRNHRSTEKNGLLKTLMAELGGRLCPVLRESIQFGIAYHHSGLTADERRLLEEAYREGVLCCICCTSTLAAGVNLPAKRVILRAPYVGREFINLSKYKQMVGRAGRAGLGASGESFLIFQSVDTAKVMDLLQSKMDDVVSNLNVDNCKELVLSAVGLGVADTREGLRRFLYHTLLYVQAERLKSDIKNITDTCITTLYKQGALRMSNEEENVEQSRLDISVGRPDVKPKKVVRVNNSAKLSVSRLGRAAMKGCMSLPIALKLYGDLMKAESSLVLLCSLHLLYLITPYQIPEQISPNYQLFFNVYMQLGAKEQHAAKVIGLSENVVSRMVMGQKPKNVPEETVNRFYVTLILNELWKHQSIWEVAALFQVPRGVVQSLMSSAANFSWNVLRFCEELEELWSVKAILTEFSPRLAHCCEAELLPLMDLPSVKRARARQLYNAGFKTIQQVARADTKTLVTAVENMPIRTASQIIAAAKLSLMEKVENLKEEADEVLEDLASANVPSQ